MPSSAFAFVMIAMTTRGKTSGPLPSSLHFEKRFRKMTEEHRGGVCRKRSLACCNQNTCCSFKSRVVSSWLSSSCSKKASALEDIFDFGLRFGLFASKSTGDCLLQQSAGRQRQESEGRGGGRCEKTSWRSALSRCRSTVS
jgi:hypothetical protein